MICSIGYLGTGGRLFEVAIEVDEFRSAILIMSKEVEKR